MRAPIFVLAIVICTVTALAVLSKSKAEEETDDNAAPTAQSDVKATDVQKTESCEAKINAADAEEIVARSMIGVDQLWGDRIRWSQLGSAYSLQDEWPYQTNLWSSTSVSIPRTTKEKTYIDAARKLDEAANDLDDARLYQDADAVRTLTLKLRARARALQADPTEPPAVQLGFGFYSR